jgi:hypothetical protein
MRLTVDYELCVNYLLTHYVDGGTMGAGLCGFCSLQVDERYFDQKTLSGICDACRAHVAERRSTVQPSVLVRR